MKERQMKKRKKQEWRFMKGGMLLSGLIGSRGFKTRQCQTAAELVALARHVFGIDAGDLDAAVCQIRDLQTSDFVRLTKNLPRRQQAHYPAGPHEKRGANVIPFREGAVSQKAINAFYDSWDWKHTRYDFLKDKKRRCQCCGATPDDGPRIVVDHIKPIRHFWSLRLDPTNLQMLCDDCNRGKGSRDTTDWRKGLTDDHRSSLMEIADEFAWRQECVS
jgi:5-methylcytosine-specific restriction endonuclease McrA